MRSARLIPLVFGCASSLAISSRRSVLAASAAATAAPLASCPAGAAEESAGSLVQRGMREFINGEVKASIASFDAAEARNPKLATRLWQRGLSQYYAGQYEAAANQFLNDVADNPNDTEEAIWRFLSIAQARGFEAAQRELVTITGERRPFMRAVYNMFRYGDATRVEALTSDTAASARFYAALYLGLYAEARGDAAASRSWIERAVGETAYATSGDYMYALARVHAKERGFLTEE